MIRRSLLIGTVLALAASAANAAPLLWSGWGGPNRTPDLASNPNPNPPPKGCDPNNTLDNGCAHSQDVISNASFIDTNFAVDTAQMGQLCGPGTNCTPTAAAIATRNSWLHVNKENIAGVDYAVGSASPDTAGNLYPISSYPMQGTTNVDPGTTPICTYHQTGFTDGGGPYLSCGPVTTPNQVFVISKWDFSNTGKGPHTGAAAVLFNESGNASGAGYSFQNDYFQDNFEGSYSFTGSISGTRLTAQSTQQLWPGEPVTGLGVTPGTTITGMYGTTYAYANGGTVGSSTSLVPMTCGGVNFWGSTTGSSTPGTINNSGTLTVSGASTPGTPIDLPNNCQFTSGIPMGSTATVASGGSGYAVNDTITLNNGEVLKVASVTSGAVHTFSAVAASPATSSPANPATQVSTSGSGTGATFTVTYTNPVLQDWTSTTWDLSASSSGVTNVQLFSPANFVWQAAHQSGAEGVYPMFFPTGGSGPPTVVQLINVTIDGNTRAAIAAGVNDVNFRNGVIFDQRGGPTQPYNWVDQVSYSAIFDNGHIPMQGNGGGGVIAHYNYFRNNCIAQHNLCHGEVAEFPAAGTTRALEEYLGNVFIRDSSQGNDADTAAFYISSGTQNNTKFGTVRMQGNVIVINNVGCPNAPDLVQYPFPGYGYGPNNQCGTSGPLLTQGAGEGWFAISGVTSIDTFDAENNVIDGSGSLSAYTNANQDALAPPLAYVPADGTQINIQIPNSNFIVSTGADLGPWWVGMLVHATPSGKNQAYSSWFDTTVASFDAAPTGYNNGPNFTIAQTGKELTTGSVVTLHNGDHLITAVPSSLGGYVPGTDLGEAISGMTPNPFTGTGFTTDKCEGTNAADGCAGGNPIAAGTEITATTSGSTITPGTPYLCNPAYEAGCGTLELTGSEQATPIYTATVSGPTAAGSKILNFSGGVPGIISVSTVGQNGYVLFDTTHPDALPVEYLDGLSSTTLTMHYAAINGGVQTGDTIEFLPMFQLFTAIGGVGGVTWSNNYVIGGSTRSAPHALVAPVAMTPWGTISCNQTEFGGNGC